MAMYVSGLPNIWKPVTILVGKQNKTNRITFFFSFCRHRGPTGPQESFFANEKCLPPWKQMWDVRSVWSQDRFFCFFIFIWQYLWWWYFSFFISLTIIILIMRRFFHNTHSQVIFLRYTFQFLRRMLPFGQRFISDWNKRLLVFFVHRCWV